MASLISSADKITLQSALTDVFDTFKRSVVLYHEPEKVVISTDPNYSRFGNNSQMTENIENVPVRHVIDARIYYLKDQENQVAQPYLGGFLDESQLKISEPKGRIRIKVEESGYQLLKDAKLVELDGFIFTPDSPPRVHGLLGVNRWTFYYKVTK